MSYPGLSRIVSSPQLGKQHIGVSPDGPQDRFAFETGHALLGSANPRSLEFMIPPKLTFTRSTQYILTGAHFSGVEHATVLHADAGETLDFGKLKIGFRGTLSWFSEAAERIGRRRPALSDLVTWNDPKRRIRLLRGPEFQALELTAAGQIFSSKPWKISKDSGSMGIRLEAVGPNLPPIEPQMISSPVADGMVQLTPSGPIVLMRGRQTVGGYPRIAAVIEVDLDRLAQFRPGEVIHFRWIEPDEACALLAARQAAISKLASS
jgi:allophanate hydrolase subunit 2